MTKELIETTNKEKCSHMESEAKNCHKCMKNALEVVFPSPSQPEWEKEFEKRFSWENTRGSNDFSIATASHLKDFIQKVSESSKEEGEKETLHRLTEIYDKEWVKDKKDIIKEERQSILKLIEGMERETKFKDSMGRPYESDKNKAYNQALSDLKNLINKR